MPSQGAVGCQAVLGIDAAWTERQPSGVSLVRKSAGHWACVAVAPSYQAFLELANGRAINWCEQPEGNAPDPGTLLDAAKVLLGKLCVAVVAVDMPLSKRPITRRREADNAVSREFGRYGCSVHSPTIKRPGPLGEALSRGFEARGYSLATTAGPSHRSAALLEVYPHPALLRLLRADYRLKYKAGRTSIYWPTESKEHRLQNVTEEVRKILNVLSEQISGIPLRLPETPASLSQLKRYEDALDSLVCSWVGMRYLEGRAIPYGDEDAAIWVPV